MVKVYALKMDNEVNDTCYKLLLSQTTEDKRKKVECYQNKENAYLSLFAEFLVRYVLIQNYQINNKDIQLKYNEDGKPELAGIKNLHFNISHSGQWIVAAIDSSPVGIDIEHVAQIDISLFKNLFSSEEYCSLIEKTIPAQVPFFYELWTLKESYIKQTGAGLSLPLDYFTMQVSDNKQVALILSGKQQDSLFFKQYEIDTQYKMAVCALNNSFSPIHPVTQEELMNLFR
jgi:4'-phosphopantetheinyl transferase